MEEILASIRRIIADDRMLPATQREARPPDFVQETQAGAEPADATGEGSFERRRGDAPVDRPGHAEPPTLRVLEGGLPGAMDSLDDEVDEDIEAFERSLREEIEPTVEEPPSPPQAQVQSADARDEETPVIEPLMSPSTDASVASSFHSLAASVFMQNQDAIEQCVRDMLRPLLRQWIDENLPTIVERLVRAEIERVARGARG